MAFRASDLRVGPGNPFSAYYPTAASLDRELKTNGYCIITLEPLNVTLLSEAKERLVPEMIAWGSALPSDHGIEGLRYYPSPSKDVLELIPGILEPPSESHGFEEGVERLAKLTSQAVSVMHDVGRMVLVALTYHRQLPMYSLVSTFLIDEVPDPSNGQLQASVLQCSDHPLVVQPDVAEEFAAAGEGVDTGLLSIYTAEQPGMQVFGRSGWRDVLLKPNQVLVLPGQTLSYALAGQMAATKHRVLLPHSSRSGRLSALCYQLRARHDALLDPASLLGKDRLSLEARYRAPLLVTELLQQLAEAKEDDEEEQGAAGAGDEDDESIHIVFDGTDTGDGRAVLRMQRSAPLAAAMDAFFGASHTQRGDRRFHYRGHFLVGQDTPGELEMSDGAVVRVTMVHRTTM